MSDAERNRSRKQILLLGIGHTNAHVVKQWASDPLPGCDLVCISKFPSATYSGMLPGTLGWQFRDDEMQIDLRALADRANAKLILADTRSLDLQTGHVHFSDHDPISFDALSIGVGSMPAGWDQHSHSPLMVPIKPMQTFLSRLSERISTIATSQSAPLRIAIVGGGVASVEIALCLRQQFDKRNLNRGCSIEVFTSGHSVAQELRRRSVRRLELLLEARNVQITSGSQVTDVGDHEIMTAGGSRHEVDCVIWATGAAAGSVLGKLGLQTDERGFILTHKTLQSFSDARIFAVGDAGTIMESPSHKAGVYAVRQSPILWDNLRAFIAGKTLREFKPQKSFLKILNTGDGKALLEYGWLTVHACWVLNLKTWIDRQFVRDFQTGPTKV